MCYLSKVSLKFLLGVSCLVNSSSEDDIRLFLLTSHVIAGGLKYSVNDHAQRRRVLALLVCLRDVPVRKVLPLVWSGRPVTQTIVMLNESRTNHEN